MTKEYHQKRYVKGRRFEYKTKKEYEDKGYIVFRTAGSHGLVDLIAVRNDEILFIQCKSGYMSYNKAREVYDMLQKLIKGGTYSVRSLLLLSNKPEEIK